MALIAAMDKFDSPGEQQTLVAGIPPCRTGVAANMPKNTDVRMNLN